MSKGVIYGGKNRGVTGISQGQGGLVSPLVVLPKSVGVTFPLNQGGPGSSVKGYDVSLHIWSSRETTGPCTGTAVGDQ